MEGLEGFAVLAVEILHCSWFPQANDVLAAHKMKMFWVVEGKRAER